MLKKISAAEVTYFKLFVTITLSKPAIEKRNLQKLQALSVDKLPLIYLIEIHRLEKDP